MCQTDRELLAACLNGHPETFRELIARYQKPLSAYASGRSNNAEEVVQETFVRAYFSLHKLKKPESLLSWLIGIANRVTHEHHRDQQRRHQTAQALADRGIAAKTSNDVELKRAIAELPEQYREVVLLRFYGERTCTQVADQLTLPLGTVTKRLSRAYQMLRESLRPSSDRLEESEMQR